jgi:hypothetical protein
VPIYTQNGNGELPPYVKELLANWPPSGSGSREVHRHILAVANGLRHHVEFAHAGQLIRQSMPRKPKGREIEDTLKKAYNVDAVPKTDAVPNVRIDLQLIENVVAERIGAKPAVEELEERSAPIPGSTDEILSILYPAESLIHVCKNYEKNNGNTVALRDLKNKAQGFPGIVPNPMSAYYAIDADGKRHRRCMANTGPRQFIVVDIDIKAVDKHGRPTIYADLIKRWQACGVMIQDAAAAIIGYLAEHGPLVMVVYSGNISLQGWFFAQGEDESNDSPLRDFFESAVVLGADPTGWTRCQLFRMPGGTHPDTGRPQTVHFFNPGALQPPGQKDTNDDDENET